MSLLSGSATPAKGAWMMTLISGPENAGTLKVVTEWRSSSSPLAGDDFWFNELTVWEVDRKGSYTSLEHQESVSSNPAKAAARHLEIVSRIVDGRQFTDEEPQS